MRKQVLAAAVLVAAPLALAAPAAHAQTTASTSQVSILHGVPGLTVDVYANNKKLLSNFTPGTLAGPLSLKAGTYDLAVYKAGANPSSAKPAIKADNVKVPGGVNVTVAAHLDAKGTPELTPFVNDTSPVAAGKGRLTVRHIAAAPAVDIRASKKVVVTDLTNPQSTSLVVPAGTISADVALAGTSTVAIGPASVNVKEGANTIVYAWGSAKDKNLKLAVQVINGMGSAPSGVNSGIVSDDSGARDALLLTGLAALLVAGMSGRRYLVSSRRA